MDDKEKIIIYDLIILNKSVFNIFSKKIDKYEKIIKIKIFN